MTTLQAGSATVVGQVRAANEDSHRVLDDLVIDTSDPQVLESIGAGRAEAIKIWVRDGGHLIIVAASQRQALLDSLKKNDRIITSGGIYGTVVAVDAEQDRVTVRICDEPAVRIQLNVRSVMQILREEKQA